MSNEIPELVNMYAPFSKVDEEKHMVYGYATTGTRDSQDEIVDLQASFAAADEWAKWRNIKEMHRPETAVGVAPVIEKHVGVGLYIGAEIVDPVAWEKCKKGVYKGFSIGGRVIERDKEKKIISKYQLLEVSLVDRPANPDSIFMVAKRDTTTEENVVGKVASMEVHSMEKTESKPPESVEKKDSQDKPPETVLKSEFDKLSGELASVKAQVEEFKKALEIKAKESSVKDEVVKVLEELKPMVKKKHEELDKPQETIEQKLKKMSVGELSVAMLKTPKRG